MQAPQISSCLARDFCDNGSNPNVEVLSREPTFDELLRKAVLHCGDLDSSILATVKQESHQNASLLSRADLKSTDLSFQTGLFRQEDIDYLRYSFSQLEADSAMLKAVSQFLEGLEQALGDEHSGRRLATCLKRATARIAATNERMVSNFERIFPTGPSRTNKIRLISTQFEGCGKALLLRAFYDL